MIEYINRTGGDPVCLFVFVCVCVCVSVEALVHKRLDLFRRHSGFEVGQQFASGIFYFFEKLISMTSQPPFIKSEPALSRPKFWSKNIEKIIM